MAKFYDVEFPKPGILTYLASLALLAVFSLTMPCRSEVGVNAHIRSVHTNFDITGLEAQIATSGFTGELKSTNQRNEFS